MILVTFFYLGYVIELHNKAFIKSPSQVEELILQK